MTDQEWRTAVDPWLMLEFLQREASERKLRLFGIACCRRKWEYFTDDRCRHAVEVAERYADNNGLEDELERAYSASLEVCREWDRKETNVRENGTPARISVCASSLVTADVFHIVSLSQEYPRDSGPAVVAETRAQAILLRDIFGNPFAPLAVDPAWLTSTVLALAKEIYDGKAFDRFPVLADALADAGCENDDLLGHCRGDGPHVRGCWAVDLILGKV